jgi:hemerythrin-like metal-binding protein
MSNHTIYFYFINDLDREITTVKPFLIWRDDWLLGFDDIDEQHLELVEALNKLYQNIARNKDKNLNPDISQICEQLSILGNMARKHFQYEEAIMQECSYPLLADHHREHIMLLAELKAYILEIRSGARPFTMKTLTSLKHWQIDHLLGSDRKFADFLKSQSQSDKDRNFCINCVTNSTSH